MLIKGTHKLFVNVGSYLSLGEGGLPNFIVTPIINGFTKHRIDSRGYLTFNSPLKRQFSLFIRLSPSTSYDYFDFFYAHHVNDDYLKNILYLMKN